MLDVTRPQTTQAQTATRTIEKQTGFLDILRLQSPAWVDVTKADRVTNLMCKRGTFSVALPLALMSGGCESSGAP